MRWNRIWKLTAVLAAVSLAAGMPAAAAETGEQARGRYLEAEMQLPEGAEPIGIVRRDDGTLRIAARGDAESVDFWETADLGKTWEKAASLSGDAGGYFSEIAMQRDGGGAACSFADLIGEDTRTFHLSFDADGNAVRTDLDEEIPRNYAFSADGTLAGIASGGAAWTVDPGTGEELVQLGGPGVDRLAVCGGEALLVTGSEVNRCELASGDPLGRDEALTEALFAGGRQYGDIYGQGHELVFAEDEEGRLYLCSHDGIYVHSVGGSAVEQLVDGALTSLANPSMTLRQMEVVQGVVCVICVDSEGRDSILTYTYDPDVASIPEKEVTVWSLRKDEGLQEAVAAFQKQNPEIYVNCEMGLGGDDGVTVSDALRTLNTDILAGNGPDVLLLDGLNVASYAGKGLLRDLSALLDEVRESDGLVEPVADVWKTEDGVYAVPLTFAIPMAVGYSDNLEKLKDIDTLAALAGEPKMLDSQIAIQLPELLYYTTAGSWIQEDGTIDAEALRRCVSAVCEIFDGYCAAESDEAKLQQLRDAGRVAEMLEFYEAYGIPYGDLGMGILEMLSSPHGIYPGVLTNMTTYAQVTALLERIDGYEVKLFSGSGEGHFLPLGTLGLAANGRNPEEAESFLRYLLSKEGERQYRRDGFAVNLAALRDAIFVDQFGGDAVYISSGNSETGEIVELKCGWPDEERLNWLMEAIETLDRRTESERIQMEAVTGETRRCMYGEITVDEAVESILQKVNLYLAENGS